MGHCRVPRQNLYGGLLVKTAVPIILLTKKYPMSAPHSMLILVIENLNDRSGNILDKISADRDIRIKFISWS
jgi:hypothetical protein